MLLHYGADPNLANAIHTSIRSEEHEAWKIKLLLGYGANKDAVEWAGNALMTHLLHQNGVAPAAAVAVAYALGKAQVVQFLLDTSVDPNSIPSRGKLLPGIKRERRARQKLRKDSLVQAKLVGKERRKAWQSGAPGSGRGTRDMTSIVKPRIVLRSKVKRGVRMHARGQAASV